MKKLFAVLFSAVFASSVFAAVDYEARRALRDIQQGRVTKNAIQNLYVADTAEIGGEAPATEADLEAAVTNLEAEVADAGAPLGTEAAVTNVSFGNFGATNIQTLAVDAIVANDYYELYLSAPGRVIVPFGGFSVRNSHPTSSGFTNGFETPIIRMQPVQSDVLPLTNNTFFADGTNAFYINNAGQVFQIN